jgi:transcriptional regulator with XRE-family HTH domain
MVKMENRTHPIDKHVGARIREIRLLRRMSQADLANAMTPPITFQQIQKYEKGTNRVSSGRLWDLAHALDVHIMYFFESSAGARKNGEMISKRSAPDEVYFTADEIDLVHIYRQVGGDDVKGKMRDLLKAVAGQLP